ncbi:MAG: TIGR01906 family membrane protein [Chloroflexi bacterium]|nr:MAG: TIGR01906 family membrane protein [Chloroflexota bacterium]
MRNLSPRLVALLQWLLTLLLPYVLVISSLYIFMSPQFIEWQYAQPDFPPADRFTPDQRTYNAVETVLYTRGERTEQQLKALGVYNEREIKHLVDVYNVSRPLLQLNPLFILIMLGAFILLWRNPATRRNAGTGLMFGGILTFVLVGFVGLVAVFAFDTFFVAFHRVFFEGDTWLFNYSDSLIQFYPELFWMKASYGIALFVMGGAVLFTALGVWLRQRARK